MTGSTRPKTHKSVCVSSATQVSRTILSRFAALLPPDRFFPGTIFENILLMSGTRFFQKRMCSFS